MRRIIYAVIGVIVFTCAAYAAIIANTPTLPSPLLGTDKVPAGGRAGSSAARTVTMNQVGDFVQARMSSVTVTPQQKATWDAKQNAFGNGTTLARFGAGPTYNGVPIATSNSVFKFYSTQTGQYNSNHITETDSIILFKAKEASHKLYLPAPNALCVGKTVTIKGLMSNQWALKVEGDIPKLYHYDGPQSLAYYTSYSLVYICEYINYLNDYYWVLIKS